MVFELPKNLEGKEGGITLVEIIIVIFIIAVFSMIVISDFPEIQRQSALSRATYNLAQDLRKIQDLGLSGAPLTDASGHQITDPFTNKPIAVRGYGIYVNSQTQPTSYIIYADVANEDGIYDNKYDDNSQVCMQPLDDPHSDCVIEIIDLGKENPNLVLSGVLDIGNNYNNISSGVSINFSPPNPITNIQDDYNGIYTEIGIVLGLKSESSTRTVQVNTSGLISVQ